MLAKGTGGLHMVPFFAELLLILPLAHADEPPLTPPQQVVHKRGKDLGMALVWGGWA